MNILITGGAGYLGSKLIHLLINHSQVKRLVIFENFTTGNKNIFRGLHDERISVLEGDLLNSLDVEFGLRKIDLIIHLAAISHTPLSGGVEKNIIKVNAWGTENILKAAIKYNVKKIIFSSTITINGAIDQDGKVYNDNNAFSRSKRIAEELLMEAFHKNKINIEILRFGTLYGISPLMNFSTFVNKMAFDAAIDKRIVILGNGIQKRVVTSIEKASFEILKYLELNSQTKINEIYDNIISPAEIAQIVSEELPNVNQYYTDQDNLTRFSFLPKNEIEITSNQKEEFKIKFLDIINELKLWK